MMEDQCLNDSEVKEVDRLKCGACGFSTNRISDLHYHQQVHGIGGSYYFCHLSKTAFPRFDHVSFGSQTDPLDFALAQILDSSNVNPSLIDTENAYFSYGTIQCEDKQTFGDNDNPGKANILRHDDKNERKGVSNVGPMNSFQKNGEHIKRCNDKNAVNGNYSESIDHEAIEIDSENKANGVLNMDNKESSFNSEAHLCKNSFNDALPTDIGNVDNESDPNSQAIALASETHTSHIVNDHSYEHPGIYDQNVVNQTRLHACVFCEDVTFRRKLSLLRHLKKYHNNELPYKCDECKKYLVSMTDAERHAKLHKRGQYECPVCLKKVSSELNLVEHITDHTGEKPFQCKLCPNRYRKKQSLDLHVTCHSDKKSHVCEFCGKAFSSRVKVASHVWSCVKNVECGICKKMFSGQCKLKVHMRKHTKERPYVCEVCGCAFSYGSGLVRHKKFIHTKQKDHKCSNCDMRFVTKQSLDRHEKVHSSVKGYACSVCSKSFRAEWTLKVHNRIHTGEMPYACDFCEKRFKINKTRKAHQSSCPMKN